MPKYEIAIAVRDETDYTSGDWLIAAGNHRKQEGDIISMKPYPRNCGLKVLDSALVIIVECSKSDRKALKQKLTRPLFENGLVEDVDFRELATEDGLDYVVYPKKQYVWDRQARMPIKRPKMIAKRRYKIPLNMLGNIDLVKVRNPTYIYQPFKKASQLVEKFDGKGANEFLEEKDVDCVALGVSKEQEKVFQWSQLNNLIMDKYTNSYISP